MPDPLYRSCVGIALFNRGGLVFVGRRRGLPETEEGHAWQMPQGGIDPGETPFAAALRELYEETGVRSASVLAETPDWITYQLPAALAGRAWGGRFQGQKQKWFALRFDGEDGDIDIGCQDGAGHPPEFEAWRWERLERTPELVIPFKRQVYEAVAERFREFAVPARATEAG